MVPFQATKQLSNPLRHSTFKKDRCTSARRAGLHTHQRTKAEHTCFRQLKRPLVTQQVEKYRYQLCVVLLFTGQDLLSQLPTTPPMMMMISRAQRVTMSDISKGGRLEGYSTRVQGGSWATCTTASLSRLNRCSTSFFFVKCVWLCFANCSSSKAISAVVSQEVAPAVLGLVRTAGLWSELRWMNQKSVCSLYQMYAMH